MSQFNDIMIVEGVEETETEEKYIEALQNLIDSGIVWQLQGSFGRTAQNFIDAGKCRHKEE